MRGGAFSYVGIPDGYEFKLKNMRWTEDVAVSGTVRWNIRTNIITSEVELLAAGGSAGTLRTRWNDADFHALATVDGEINGTPVKAQGVAP